MNVILKDGTVSKLGRNEFIEDRPCDKCGGTLVTNYGDGISCTFCADCGESEYNYF